ncbi:transglycosylase domain-containing protein [Marinilactibacillus sp. Marseille-P9653]|uniref:transglycosylase domain-containing protein n=1 Tax=Marinilactibacillus sp. Marseille-P9653 TaxID=2866583 RepID=UPI001CE4631D|nr:transglycosylase domain-containing protein [Marinilactibacillus sp. Marseille-P9653]
MKRSEHKNKEKTEETSSKRGFFYYFDISYRVIKTLVVLFFVTLLIGGSLGTGAAIGYFASLVDDSEIPEYSEMESQIDDFVIKSTMYYAGGEVISDVRSDLIRTSIDLDQMSPYVKDAIIATEDEYFYEHNGIVPKAVARALVQDLTNSASSSGGSTLTQQLIKQQLVGSEVSHSRKANEILLAMRLENALSKDDILQSYLNISPFGRNNKGQNIAGVQEAALGIFGIPASDLTLPQAAFIAGLPQSPISYSPYTQTGDLKEDQTYGLRRLNEVLFRMLREGYITEDEYNEALNYDVTGDFIEREASDGDDTSYVYDLAIKESTKILAQEFIKQDEVSAETLASDEDLRDEYNDRAESALRNGGYKVYTTIDRDVHQAVEQVVAEQVDTLGSERTYTYVDSDDVTQTATMPIQVSGSLIDNATGKVLSFIGGRDYDSSVFNRAFEADRSPGSIIKPLATFGPALDIGLITPATIIPDTPVTFPIQGSEDYEPTNAGPITNRWMTAREALTISQNIPTLKIYNELKEQVNPVEYMNRMGIDEIPADAYSQNLSTAIGGVSSGPAPVDLISAFSSIANNGAHVDPYVIEKIEDSSGEAIFQHQTEETQVWSPQTNYLLLDILRDVHTDGTARGTISQLNFDSDWISKTGTSGTSDKVDDIWYIGSTPRITFGTWIGYDNKVVGLIDEFGQSASLRNRNFWAKVVNRVYETKPELLGAGEQYAQPENIVQQSVLSQTGMLPGTVELPGGGTRSISGETFNEYFNTAHLPQTTTYDFAIGATDEELSEFWGSAGSNNTEDDINNSDEDEDPSPAPNTNETNESAPPEEAVPEPQEPESQEAPETTEPEQEVEPDPEPEENTEGEEPNEDTEETTVPEEPEEEPDNSDEENGGTAPPEDSDEGEGETPEDPPSDEDSTDDNNSSDEPETE